MKISPSKRIIIEAESSIVGNVYHSVRVQCGVRDGVIAEPSDEESYSHLRWGRMTWRRVATPTTDLTLCIRNPKSLQDLRADISSLGFHRQKADSTTHARKTPTARTGVSNAAPKPQGGSIRGRFSFKSAKLIYLASGFGATSIFHLADLPTSRGDGADVVPSPPATSLRGRRGPANVKVGLLFARPASSYSELRVRCEATEKALKDTLRCLHSFVISKWPNHRNIPLSTLVTKFPFKVGEARDMQGAYHVEIYSLCLPFWEMGGKTDAVASKKYIILAFAGDFTRADIITSSFSLLRDLAITDTNRLLLSNQIPISQLQTPRPPDVKRPEGFQKSLVINAATRSATIAMI
ncbi:hypothetical protein EVAR_4193_1 [Eumeta japonica]|uniref:Uncharacterized protein n=1 Tax=Eumeta variegata TaxID=151549 RepID=A0A4C1TJ27_EUMVA|nr:hypothetical protein EVAR_4193_1 [Eumeta japonica]